MSTSVAIASTIGTARGSTQASWRPRPFSSVFSWDEVTVSITHKDGMVAAVAAGW